MGIRINFRVKLKMPIIPYFIGHLAQFQFRGPIDVAKNFSANFLLEFENSPSKDNTFQCLVSLMSFIHYIESIQFYTPLRHWLQSIESSPLSCVIKSAMNRYLILLVIKMKQKSKKSLRWSKIAPSKKWKWQKLGRKFQISSLESFLKNFARYNFLFSTRKFKFLLMKYIDL